MHSEVGDAWTAAPVEGVEAAQVLIFKRKALSDKVVRSKKYVLKEMELL